VEWREDLKRILRKATETDNHGVFLFSDTQVRGKQKQMFKGVTFQHLSVHNLFLSLDIVNVVKDKSRAWCKTIVTPYIK